MYIQHENIRLDDGKPVVCNFFGSCKTSLFMILQ